MEGPVHVEVVHHPPAQLDQALTHPLGHAGAHLALVHLAGHASGFGHEPSLAPFGEDEMPGESQGDVGGDREDPRGRCSFLVEVGRGCDQDVSHPFEIRGGLQAVRSRRWFEPALLVELGVLEQPGHGPRVIHAHMTDIP